VSLLAASSQEGVEALMLREGRLIVRSGEDDYQTLVNSVPTQSLTYYKLSFDLSWLSPRTVVRTARLLLLLSKPLPTTAAYTGGGVKLEVWDGSKPLKSLCSAACPTGTNGKTCFLCPPNKAALPATVPCAQPGCAGTRVSPPPPAPLSCSAAPGQMAPMLALYRRPRHGARTVPPRLPRPPSRLYTLPARPQAPRPYTRSTAHPPHSSPRAAPRLLQAVPIHVPRYRLNPPRRRWAGPPSAPA
jgi:hypothetical protein